MEPITNALAKLASNMAVEIPKQTGCVISERQLLTAISKEKLANCLLEKAIDTLLAVLYKCGIQADRLPTEGSFSLLLTHARIHYGTHSCEEIILAFDMAITGQLDLEAKEIPCYQNFSCEYFSRIMNSYRRWAVQEYRQATQSTPVALPAPTESVTDEAMQEWLNDWVLRLEGDRDYPVELLPDQLHDWLVRTGKLAKDLHLAERVLNLTLDRRRAWLVYQNDHHPGKRNQEILSRFMAMRKAGLFTGDEVDFVTTLSKKIMLKAYILNDPILTDETEQA